MEKTTINVDNVGNFVDTKKWKIYLVRCPKCDTENYAINVATGICTWCGFNANEDNSYKEKIKILKDK